MNDAKATVRSPIRRGSAETSADPEAAARILRRFGGDPAQPAHTRAAASRCFSRLRRRYAPLVGPRGYRSLLEQAHLKAVARHPVLESWRVADDDAPQPGANGDFDAEEVWSGAVALTRELLALSRDVEDANPQADADSVETPTGEVWNLLILDRDLVTCQAMAQILDGAGDFHVVGHALTVDDVEAGAAEHDVDFVIASGHLPSEEVLDLCRRFRARHPGEPPHVVVTGLPADDALILRFLEAGASSFTLGEFSVEGLRLTLRLLARGEAVIPLRLQHLLCQRLSELAELVRDRGLDPETVSSLTPRERDVLRLLEKRLTNREIARRLYISVGTVKSHVHQILHKLKVRDRSEAARVLRLRRAGGGNSSRKP